MKGEVRCPHCQHGGVNTGKNEKLMKRYNLEKCLENEIKELAEKNSIKKVILFGSRLKK